MSSYKKRSVYGFLICKEIRTITIKVEILLQRKNIKFRKKKMERKEKKNKSRDEKEGDIVMFNWLWLEFRQVERFLRHAINLTQC